MTDSTTAPALAALRRTLNMEEVAPAPEGADQATRLACWMMAAARPWPDAAAGVMETLLAAHRDGETDATVWRRLRHAAVALSDSEDAEVKACGMVAEAAAWPLSTAQAGLVELMQAMCRLRAYRASKATGWTPADDVAAHATLSAIAEGDGTHRPAREDIPKLFEAIDPALEKRFSIHLTATNAAFSAFRAEVAAWLAGAGR